jgi:hypothetical protein
MNLPKIFCPEVETWDGMTLDVLHPAWAQCSRLFLLDNLSGRQPRWATEVRIGWSDGGLQCHFLCQDPKPSATKTDHDDALWEEEVVELFLDPFGDALSYFEIEVNPLNAVVDLFARRTLTGLKKEFAWHCAGLITAVGRPPFGWMAALRVPFASLGDCAPNGTWRANFTRIDRPDEKSRELSAWSPTLVNSFHVPERFGTLKFDGA